MAGSTASTILALAPTRRLLGLLGRAMAPAPAPAAAPAHGPWSEISKLRGIRQHPRSSGRHLHACAHQSSWDQLLKEATPASESILSPLTSDQAGNPWEGTSPEPQPQPHPQPQSRPQSGFGDPDVKALLDALRRGDTFRLYLCLLRLISSTLGPTEAFAEVIAQLPPTTFSELLRAFDPLVVSQDVDTATNIPISVRMAQNTSLGEVLNRWGVRVIFVQIYMRLRQILELRRDSDHRTLLYDYVSVIRCAGAASLPIEAKKIWQSMEDVGLHLWRQSDVHSEFLKARYLTEALYADQYLARYRVRARNLHRSKLRLLALTRDKLLGMHIAEWRNSRFRFGQDPRSRLYANPLSLILRKRKPLFKLSRAAGIFLHGKIAPNQTRINRLRRPFTGSRSTDEKLICALIKAHARTGGVVFMSQLLYTRFGILLKRDKVTWEAHVSGGSTFWPGSRMAPTRLLLDAIVHGYGMNGEITAAFKLVEFVSKQYNVPVPNKTWSDLLAYAYIMATKPAVTEWTMARFPQKTTTPAHVQLLWDTITSESYNFQPGIEDYQVIVKTLAMAGRLKDAIAAVRQLKSLYGEILRENEEAYLELVQTTHQGVDNHAAYVRFRKLQARKTHMWYSLEYCSWTILGAVRSNRIDDDITCRIIPGFVRDFSRFMPPHIRYRTATGKVSLRSDESAAWAVFGKYTHLQPAFKYRPPWVTPQGSGELSLSELERLGGDFAGYPESDPVRGPYRAKYVSRYFRRPETPLVDFDRVDTESLMVGLILATGGG